MSNQYLTIRLDNTKIYLTGSISFTYDQTNLPKEAFSFNPERTLFWKIEQKKYDPISGELTVGVVDYNLSDNAILTENKPKHPIRKLNFEKLDWTKFFPLIYSYTLSKLKKMIFNYKEEYFSFINENKNIESSKPIAPKSFAEHNPPTKWAEEFNLRIKYEDAKFDASKISFPIHLKQYKLVKQLEINNNNLRPEFELIKSYFIRRLGRFFRVKIILRLLNNKVEEITAESSDINRIDENLIKSIRVSSVLDLRHLKTDREDKVLYNTKELFAEGKVQPLLEVSPKDLLEIFIANANVKNTRQLDYLAKDKQVLNEQLQFTIKPLFGFVFYVFADKQYFIWELLNSHATYVWKNNDTESKLDLGKVVEEAIGIIKKDGREVYKKYYKGIDNPGFDFGVIMHSSSNLTEEERFNEWKRRLEEYCS